MKAGHIKSQKKQEEINKQMIQASWIGSTDIVKMMLEEGADVNATDSKGYTALMMAVWNGNTAMVLLLLELGANVDAIDKTGEWTALKLAKFKKNKEISEVLFRSSEMLASKEEPGGLDKALKYAASKGYADAVRALLDKGANINTTSAHGNTPLIIATWKGHKTVIALLLERGAEVNVANKEGYTALDHSFKHEDREFTDLLMYYGAKATESINRLFRQKCRNGALDKVRYLLSLGVDINGIDKKGNTGLMLAIMNDHSKVAELLLARRADYHIKNYLGERAWELAYQVCNQVVIDKLDQLYCAEAPAAPAAEPSPTSWGTRVSQGAQPAESQGR